MPMGTVWDDNTWDDDAWDDDTWGDAELVPVVSNGPIRVASAVAGRSTAQTFTSGRGALTTTSGRPTLTNMESSE